MSKEAVVSKLLDIFIDLVLPALVDSIDMLSDYCYIILVIVVVVRPYSSGRSSSRSSSRYVEGSSL